MNERMEQEMNRTIQILRASMPRKTGRAGMRVLLRLSAEEMNGALLLEEYYPGALEDTYRGAAAGAAWRYRPAWGDSGPSAVSADAYGVLYRAFAGTAAVLPLCTLWQ